MMETDADLIFQEPQQQIIQEVIDQIEKDFGILGFTFENHPYSKIEQLLPELHDCIEKAQNEQHGKWMKVVYRVDLTEKQYRFVQNLGGSTPANMAKAVILREFQKVQNRKFYS